MVELSIVRVSFQDDSHAVDEAGHRRQPTQGDHREGRFRHLAAATEALQGEFDSTGLLVPLEDFVLLCSRRKEELLEKAQTQ